MKNIGQIPIYILAAFLFLTLVQAVVAGDWPMFRHDAAHTGVADEVVGLQLGSLWSYTTGGSVFAPAISGGVVYVGLLMAIYNFCSACGAGQPVGCASCT